MAVTTHGFSDYVAHPRHGPLPMILLAVTVVTGAIDALSLLALGRVFVANMTGNVVFIGFALGGAAGFSLWGSVLALVGFLAGAMVGGTLITRAGGRRDHLLRNALGVEFVLALASLIAAILMVDGPGRGYVIVVLLALGLGLQNAAVRHLAVPDMTTTVLTMALTGIGSDLRKRDGAAVLRRLSSVVAMFLGAILGTVVVLHSGVVATLVLVAALFAAILVVVWAVGRRERPWQVAA